MSGLGWFGGAHLLAMVVAGGMAAVALQYRESPGAGSLAVMCGAAGVWSGIVVVSLLVADFGLLQALHTVRYSAVAVLVAAFLAFSLVYTGYVKRVSLPLVGVLAVHPVAMTGLLATQPGDESLVAFVPDETVGIAAEGTAITVHQFYAYALLVIGSAVLVHAALRSGPFYRRQYGLLLLGTAVPWLTNALFLAGFLTLDLTPVAFTVAGGVYLVAVREFGMIDVSPVARDMLVDAIGQAMLVVDDDGRVLDTNEGFTALFDIEDQPTGRQLSAVLGAYPALASALSGEQIPQEVEAGGQWFEVTVSTLAGDSRRHSGQLILLQDITKRKERERQVEASERRYRTLAENFPRGVVALFDESLTYVLVAGGLFDAIERSPADFEGKRIGDVHTPGYVELFGDMFEAVFDGESGTFEFSHGDRYYRSRLVPVRDADGAVRQGLSMTTDITELKQRERDLERRNEQLEMVAGVISHDLRNPLNVAMARTELATTTGDLSHLEPVERAHDRMEDIIDDVLTLAREGGAIGETEQISLEAVARRAWGHVDTGDATLSVDGDSRVEADHSRLSQVFENLFRNALEHGHAGSVTVGTLADNPGFYVEDDGPGIPADERDAILEPGYTDQESGTGLGLTIVANVVEAHGWSLSVTEGSTGGARFEVHMAGETEWKPQQTAVEQAED